MTCSENQEIIANGDVAILPDYTVLASAVDNLTLVENIAVLHNLLLQDSHCLQVRSLR